ncbi:uncharacterized protein LOC124309686 [Neodiprion virginianus]|uniref:uncharacterized protein LOC124309686 n=1 Tax=Neodiprion virginianus TaxID=2961670 RepID=UPI001EE760FE|nr:uncharacterized protein LOC124309686 [Neodiprion virginianus]
MGHQSCCVVDCKNTSRNSNCKFYKFPVANWKLNQRKKWIAAVKRQNIDGSLWSPKPMDVICSEHFISGEKSDIESSPNFAPTIFPSAYRRRKVNESAVLNRHKRFMERRIMKKSLSSTAEIHPVMNFVEPPEIAEGDQNNTFMNQTVEQACEANIYFTSNVSSKTFICNRYITNNKCDAETQTEILEASTSKIITNNKKYVNKECGTPHRTFADHETQVTNMFEGFSSVKKNEQLIDLAGVTFNNFNFLLDRTKPPKKSTIGYKDRLFIFLMKLKTGLTFSALGVLFNVHRTTISRIFFDILEQLASTTANLVFWPDIDVVQATMPECFHHDYSDTRVIIDCTEFNIEIPANVDHRVYCYSHYKKNFTAKVLIGITPGGFISLKSKVAGGRKSDSQMTIESGLLDLLEDGDVVLADKGFPEIKTFIDASGKKLKMVMPPFLEKKSEFTTQQTQETYSIAKVRIHIERIMQRLRLYQVLNKFPENLFHCVDDIIHVCCVLVKRLTTSCSVTKPTILTVSAKTDWKP